MSTRSALGWLALAAGLTWAASGLSRERDGLDPLQRLPSTIRGELPRAHLTVLGVVVGRDTLRTAEQRLGTGLRFAPVAGADVVAVCYESDDGLGDVVVFQADPRDPDGVVLMAHATRRTALGGMARHCQPSAAFRDGVRNAAGVTLGMSHDQFIARFRHPPSEDHARAAGYYFYDLMEPRVAVGGQASCQLLSGIRIRTLQGEALAFSVYRFYQGAGC